MGFLIRILGADLIREILTDLYHWWKHRKRSADLCEHKFFDLMERELNDEIPAFLIKMTNPEEDNNSIYMRRELFQKFFSKKICVFRDKMRDTCRKFRDDKVLKFESEWIIEWCYLYNGEAMELWSKLGKKNNAMGLFTTKFHKVHLSNIKKTKERIEYILNKDIVDYEKLDRILDTLYWAFKLSLPSVLQASRQLNGDLTRELKKP